MEVWQLPHAIFSDPCGLRTGPRCMFCCARPPMSAAVNKTTGSRRLIFDLGSMATHAVFRRWLVEHHRPPIHFLLGVVTILARHPFVSAHQRETGLLVIEFAGLPPDVVVAGFATLVFGHGGELAGVNVLLTPPASERRLLKYHLGGAQRKRRGAVTLLAASGAVRSGESEPGLGMIEARHLPPRPRVVADLAGRCGPWTGNRRPVPYLRLVRVQVTAAATAIGNLVGHCVLELGPLLVAFAAGSGDVAAFQRKARLVVTRQRELRRLEAVHRVAGFATVLVWRVRKLAGVYVTVAVYAFLVPNLIASRRARRLVALIASYRGMLAEQWIRAFSVRQHRVSGGLPAIGGMATGAVARVAACGKLPPMDVLVAGLTLLMRHRGLVVGGLVALVAGHRRVLAQQREFRLGMVERRERISRRLPGEIGMARIAAGGEGSAMRVLVAIGALRKRHSGVTDDLCAGIGD